MPTKRKVDLTRGGGGGGMADEEQQRIYILWVDGCGLLCLVHAGLNAGDGGEILLVCRVRY